jgi:hypothetical protein
MRITFPVVFAIGVIIGLSYFAIIANTPATVPATVTPTAIQTATSTPVLTPTPSNPLAGDLHSLLVPAGFLVGKWKSNMAWKKGSDAIYFEVEGSGDGQFYRKLTVLTLFRDERQVWSSHVIKIKDKNVYIQDEGQHWVRVFDGENSQLLLPAAGMTSSTANSIAGTASTSDKERAESAVKDAAHVRRQLLFPFSDN